MSPLQRALTVVVTPTLLALTLTACGGGDGGGSSAPANASTADFCQTFAGVSGVTDGAGVKAFGQKLAAVGTPSDMPDDARTGFEVFVREAGKVDANASIDNLGGDVSSDDQAAVTAFVKYATTHCASEISSAIPSAVPTS